MAYKLQITSSGYAPKPTADSKKLLGVANLAEKWKKLEEAIVGIHSHHGTPISFEELYGITFQLMLDKCAKEMHDKYRELVGSHIRNEVLPGMLGELNSDSLLKSIVSNWEEHETSTWMASSVFMLLDRQSGLAPVCKIGVAAFKKEIIDLPDVRDKLVTNMLRAISLERERKGDVEWDLLEKANAMLLKVNRECSRERLFYEDYFEERLLDQTRDFYRRKLPELVEAGYGETFLRALRKSYTEERSRVERYLDHATQEKMLRVLYDELLGPHLFTALRMEDCGMFFFLESQCVNALRIVYELSQGGRAEVAKMLGEYITTKGTEIFKSATGAIVGLIELDNTLKRCIAEAFDGDEHFKEMLEKSFYRVMGTHAELPQLLSSYIGERIKVAETDAQLAESVTMFKYLAEKDAFERQYVKDFGKRLLTGKYNAEIERSLIQQFKTECGSAYTDRMEQMFKDIDISASHYFEFRDRDPEVGDRLAVQVLKSVNWRLPESRCKLPPAMEGWFSRFNAFYNRVHNGRRLRLCTTHGTVELKASFGENQQLTKTLIVPTGLACVLAEFNQHDTRTFEQLLKDTDLPERDLRRYLQSVSMGAQKQRIMLRKGQGEAIAPGDEFSINESFTCKSTRVVIQLGSSVAQTTEEQDDFKKQLYAGRKVEIEAAIVRTMKARQTLEHNSLVVEVVNQLAKRFQPDQTLIKRCIEDLIEREYLRRIPDDHRRYRYVA